MMPRNPSKSVNPTAGFGRFLKLLAFSLQDLTKQARQPGSPLQSFMRRKNPPWLKPGRTWLPCTEGRGASQNVPTWVRMVPVIQKWRLEKNPQFQQKISTSSFQISYVLLESTKIYSTQNPHIYLRHSYKHRNTSIAFCQLPVSCPIFSKLSPPHVEWQRYHPVAHDDGLLVKASMPRAAPIQAAYEMVKSTASQSNVLQDPKNTASFWYLRCLFGFRGNQKHMNDMQSCVRISYSIIWLNIRVPEGPQNWSCRLLVCWQVPFQSALKKEQPRQKGSWK